MTKAVAVVKKKGRALVSKRGGPIAETGGSFDALIETYTGKDGERIYIPLVGFMEFKALRIKSRKTDPEALIPLASWGAHYAKLARSKFSESEIWQAFMSPVEGEYMWDANFLNDHFAEVFDDILEDIKDKYINRKD